MTGIGHNSDVGGIAGAQLRSFIERIERIEEEIKGLNDDKSDIYKEAKAVGFDAKAMRIIVRERAKDRDKLQEERTILDLYRAALGME